MRRPVLEPLGDRPLNANSDPPRPWTCQTHARHDCSGPVIGFVGAYPVCLDGAPAEIAAREADDRRIAALMATPEIQREIAREHAWESRVS